MASRMTNQHLEKLIRERERLRAAIAEQEAILRGIERAIELVGGEDDASYRPVDGLARGAMKRTVLGLFEERPEGLKTLDVVDLSAARGVNLDRASVASLLSRLTKDGVLEYDRDAKTYRIPRKEVASPLRSVA